MGKRKVMERRGQKAVYAVYRMYRDFIIPHTANLDNWTRLDCSEVEVEEAEQSRAEHGKMGTSRSEIGWTGQEWPKAVVSEGGRETEWGDKEGR